MEKKKIIFTKHASERMLERKIPVRTVFTILQKGVKIKDKESRAMLCIYKQKGSKFYTLVTDEIENQVTIISAYESSGWQIEQYKKVKKYERSKVQ